MRIVSSTSLLTSILTTLSILNLWIFSKTQIIVISPKDVVWPTSS